MAESGPYGSEKSREGEDMAMGTAHCGRIDGEAELMKNLNQD